MKLAGLSALIALALMGCSHQPTVLATSAERAFLDNMRSVGFDPEKCAFGASEVSAAGQSFARTMASANADGNYNFPDECIRTEKGKTTIRGSVEGSQTKLTGTVRLKDKDHRVLLKCFETIRCR